MTLRALFHNEMYVTKICKRRDFEMHDWRMSDGRWNAPYREPAVLPFVLIFDLCRYGESVKIIVHQIILVQRMEGNTWFVRYDFMIHRCRCTTYQ